MVSHLKTRIQGACSLCGGDGYLDATLCNCALKFRAFNRLLYGGFHEDTLNLVSGVDFQLPLIEKGVEQFNFIVKNPMKALEDGLSLFIHSKENGLGKTTLAHYITYCWLWVFSKTENYKPSRFYAFKSIQDLYDEEEIRKGELRRPSEYRSVQTPSWEATVLVVDEFANESRNAAWSIESNTAFLNRIFHYRRAKCLPTFITSNSNPTTVSSLYSGVLDSVLEIRPDGCIGGKLFREIEVGGDGDFRLKESNWPV